MDPHATGAAGVLVFLLVIGLGVFVLWLWSLIHAIINKRLSDTNRVIAVVLIVVLGILGSLIYLFIPREAPMTRRRGRTGRIAENPYRRER